MDSFSRKSLGFMLVLCIVVSSYLAVVQVVNCLKPAQIVKTLDVRSLRGSSARGEYVVGDVLVIEAEHDVADTYVVEIRCGSSIVYEQQGAVGEFRTEASVYLDPAFFKAGRCYLLVFRVCSCNRPVPGVFFNDFMSSAFTLTIAETGLKLDATYNGTERSLCLRANLTDETGSPVIGESISFSTRRSPGRGVTEGWLPLRSVQTDTGGVASLQCAFCLPDGNYSARALHNGTENFGASEKVKTIEVVANVSCVGRGFGSDLFSGCGFASFFGDLDIDVSSLTPYAGLPMALNVSFAINVSLGESLWMDFYLDNVSETSCFGSVEAWRRLVGGTYVYECFMVWEPDVVGFHSVIVEILDIGASGSVDLWIQPCPSNLVLYCPKVVYNGTVPVTVALSRARIYDEVRSDWHSACTLASRITYNGLTFVFDEPVNYTSIRLFVNGTLQSENLTDDSGVVCFLQPFGLSGGRAVLNLTAVVVSDFYACASTQVISVFNEVNVFDAASSDGFFSFNYTAGKLSENGELYVEAMTGVDVEAKIFNESVSGIPVSVVCAKLLSRFKAGVSVSEPLPYGASYLRLLECVYTVPGLIADVNYDEYVGIDDIYAVGTAFGSMPGYPNWNPECDLNHDQYVGIDDLFMAGPCFGSTGVYDSPSYFSPEEVCITFDNDMQVFLDSKGCTSIPSGAASFNVSRNGQSVGAVFQFFYVSSDESSFTNNVGSCMFSVNPEEVGEYLLQAKSVSNLELATAFLPEAGTVYSGLNVLGYFDVVKRPLIVSVEYSPDNVTADDNVTMVANVFDLGLDVPADGAPVEFYLFDYVGNTDILMGQFYSNSSGLVSVEWSPREYMQNYSLYAYFVITVVVNETVNTLENWTRVVVDARYPTVLELLTPEIINTAAGVFIPQAVVVRLTGNGTTLSWKRIYLYRDGSQASHADTNASGIAYWDGLWPEGTYCYYAVFEDQGNSIDPYYRSSNEVKFLVNVNATLVSVLLDVNPSTFKPGTMLTIGAQVVNVTSGLALSNRTVNFYRVTESGGVFYLDSDLTDSSGWARINHYYNLSLGVYSFLVNVSYAKVAIVSPTTVQISDSTFLMLKVWEKEKGSFNYTVSGQLSGLFEGFDASVKIYVNDALVDTVTARGSSGTFNTSLSLQPANNTPTVYNVKAVFEGSPDSENVTSYLCIPNGTQYPVCTAIYHGLAPATNCLSLTVEPLATQVEAASNITVTEEPTTNQTIAEVEPPPSPEQVEDEAKDSGYLTIWHEFSWWYPWYRCHLMVNCSLPQGRLLMDYGWTLLPFGQTFECNEVVALMINDLATQVYDFGKQVLLDLIKDYLVGMVVQHLASWLLGKTLAGVLLAIGIYTGYCIYETYKLYTDSGSDPCAWLAAFLVSVAGGTCGLLKAGLDKVVNWFKAAGRRFMQEIHHAMDSLWARGLDFFDITGIAFSLIDFAFAALYLYQFVILIS